MVGQNKASNPKAYFLQFFSSSYAMQFCYFKNLHFLWKRLFGVYIIISSVQIYTPCSYFCICYLIWSLNFAYAGIMMDCVQQGLNLTLFPLISSLHNFSFSIITEWWLSDVYKIQMPQKPCVIFMKVDSSMLDRSQASLLSTLPFKSLFRLL